MGLSFGSLFASLTLESASFMSGLDAARKKLGSTEKAFADAGSRISKIGTSLTAAVTAPLVGLGVAAVKTAANFESAMNKVSIATQATGAQMKAMSDLSLDLGKSTVFSASEAAGAMEELAKNGVGVADILGGAAKAAVDLAAAAGSELEPAAVAVSDAMNQFHLSSKDLPALVNQITGAVNESKLDFADFQLAMAQAGGVAGGLGVSFTDFNAVLAGTSSLFASGSDAGTAFKTFLTSFVPRSKQAAKAMEDYGLSFFDASGKMRSMADIAEMLRDKLGKLDDKAKNDVLSTIFGADSMRTAIGLMNLGSKGLDDIAAKIAKTDAAAQSAQRMTGLNSQLEQLSGTMETLAIQIGQTGLLTTVTTFVSAITDMLDRLTEFSPAAAQVAVAAAAIAAAIGPIMMVLGPIVSGFGTLAGLFSGASTAAGGAAAATTSLAAVLGPLAIAVGAVVLAWKNWDTIGPWISGVVDRTMRAATDIDGWLAKIQHSADDMDRRMGMPAKTDMFDGLKANAVALYREVDSWFRAVDQWAKDFDAGAVRAWQSFERMHAKVQASFTAMVDGISSAVMGKLNTALTWVSDKAKAVGDAFYTLYDRVVGHSYVPDMVDGIAEHMARLDVAMVKPARDATAKAASAFQKLRDDLKPLMDDLFPEVRGAIDLEKDLSTIERARKGGVLTDEQAAEARRRREIGRDGVEGIQNRPDVMDGWEIPGPDISKWEIELPDLSKMAKKTTEEIIENFAGMARDVTASLGTLAQNIKSGDIWGALTSVLDIVTQVTGMIRGTKTGGAPSTFPIGISGARAMGGPVLPNRAYLVGERGPEILRMGGAGGSIVPSHEIGRASTVKVLVQANDYFDARVDSRATGVSVATVGVNNRSAALRGRQSLGGGR